MTPDITSYNSTGIETIFLYVNDITDGLFISMFLFSIFAILTLYSYFVSKRTTGVGNLMGSAVAGSFVTLGACIILTSVTSLVTLNILLMWLVLTIILFSLWIFLRD